MSVKHPGIDEPGYLIPVFSGDSAIVNSLILVEVHDGTEGAHKLNTDVDPGVVRHDPPAVTHKHTNISKYSSRINVISRTQGWSSPTGQ